jgi:hypothetical protein
MGLDNAIKDQLTTDSASAYTVSGSSHVAAANNQDTIARTERTTTKPAKVVLPSEGRRTTPLNEVSSGLPAATYLETNAASAVADSTFNALSQAIGNRQLTPAASSDMLDSQRQQSSESDSPYSASTTNRTADRPNGYSIGRDRLQEPNLYANAAQLAAVHGYLYVVADKVGFDPRYLSGEGDGRRGWDWTTQSAFKMQGADKPFIVDQTAWDSAPTSIATAIAWDIVDDATSHAFDPKGFELIPSSLYVPPLKTSNSWGPYIGSDGGQAYGLRIVEGIPDVPVPPAEFKAWRDGIRAQVATKVEAWLSGALGGLPTPAPIPPHTPGGAPPVIDGPSPNPTPPAPPIQPVDDLPTLPQLVAAFNAGDLEKYGRYGSDMVSALHGWVAARPGREGAFKEIVDLDASLAADLLHYAGKKFENPNDQTPYTITNQLHSLIVKNYSETDGGAKFGYGLTDKVNNFIDSSFRNVQRDAIGKPFVIPPTGEGRIESPPVDPINGKGVRLRNILTAVSHGGPTAGEARQLQRVFFNEVVEALPSSGLGGSNFTLGNIGAYLSQAAIAPEAFRVLANHAQRDKVFDQILLPPAAAINGSGAKELYEAFRHAAVSSGLNEFDVELRNLLDNSAVTRGEDAALTSAGGVARLVSDTFDVILKSIQPSTVNFDELTDRQKNDLKHGLYLASKGKLESLPEKHSLSQFLTNHLDVAVGGFQAIQDKPAIALVRETGLKNVLKAVLLENANADQALAGQITAINEIGRLSKLWGEGVAFPASNELRNKSVEKIEYLVGMLGRAHSESVTAGDSTAKIGSDFLVDKGFGALTGLLPGWLGAGAGAFSKPLSDAAKKAIDESQKNKLRASNKDVLKDGMFWISNAISRSSDAIQAKQLALENVDPSLRQMHEKVINVPWRDYMQRVNSAIDRAFLHPSATPSPT